MDIRDLTEEIIIATYDVPSPDTWKTSYTFIYNFPFDSLNWKKLSELDSKYFGGEQQKLEQKYIREYEKEKKNKKALTTKGEKTTEYIKWRTKRAEQDELKLRKKYERETKKRAVTQKGILSKKYLKWRSEQLTRGDVHFWHHFVSNKKYLNKSFSSEFRDIINNILQSGNINNITLKINKITVDDEDELRQRYRFISKRDPLTPDGKLSQDYSKWRKKNLEKKKFIDMLRGTGIPPRPLFPNDLDLWYELTKEQKRHNKIINLYNKLSQTEIDKHNNLVSNNKEGLKEIYTEFNIFKGKTFTNGLPSILKKYKQMRGNKFVPDGRLLRLKWRISRNLFTEDDIILNPKYLKAKWSGKIVTLEDKERWELRKYIEVSKAFGSARGVLVTRLRGEGFIMIKRSDYLVNAEKCFAPNTIDPKTKEPTWDENIEPPEYSWSSKIIEEPKLTHIYQRLYPNKKILTSKGIQTREYQKWKKEYMLKNQGGFKTTNSPRLPSNPKAVTFQEIFYAELMPLYVLIREYMTSYKEEELIEFFEYKYSTKNALDPKGKETKDYHIWKEGFLKKTKGRYKSIYQYGYNRLIGESFDDWISYLRVKVPSEKALVQTIQGLGQSIWKHNPNFLKDIEEAIEEKYSDYVEQDLLQQRKRLQSFIRNKTENYLKQIFSYPFAEKIHSNSLDRYISKYNEFIKAYNKKTNVNEPLIKGITVKEKRKMARALLKSYGWYYTVPNTHFIPDKTLQEKKEIEERRKHIELKLYGIMQKFEKEKELPHIIGLIKLTKKDIIQFHKSGNDQQLAEYYEDIVNSPTKFAEPHKYKQLIKNLIPKKIKPESVIKKEFKEKQVAEIEEKKQLIKTIKGIKRMDDLKSKIGLEDVTLIGKEEKEIEIEVPKLKRRTPKPKNDWRFS